MVETTRLSTGAGPKGGWRENRPGYSEKEAVSRKGKIQESDGLAL